MLRFYLETSKENEDFCVIYYLERGLYSEASELTRQLKNKSVVSLLFLLLFLSFTVKQFFIQHVEFVYFVLLNIP